MATSDLCNELNKDTDLGPYFEPKYVHAQRQLLCWTFSSFA